MLSACDQQACRLPRQRPDCWTFPASRGDDRARRFVSLRASWYEAGQMENEKPRGPLYYADYIQLDRLLGCSADAERPPWPARPRRDALHHRSSGLRALVQADPVGARRGARHLSRLSRPGGRARAGGPATGAHRRDPARPDSTARRSGNHDPSRLPRFPGRPDPGLGPSERSISPDREQAGNAARGPPSARPRSLHVALQQGRCRASSRPRRRSRRSST